MVFRSFLVSSLAIFAGFLGGCGNKKAEAPAVERKTMVINVLPVEYYQDCHITGSLNIPYDETFEQGVANLVGDKDTTQFVVHCSDPMCTASFEAAKDMKSKGFMVKAFEGGMAEWYQKAQTDAAAYPFEGPAQEAYLKKPLSQGADHGDVEIISAEALSALIVPVSGVEPATTDSSAAPAVTTEPEVSASDVATAVSEATPEATPVVTDDVATAEKAA